MRIDILTLFPEMFAPLKESIIGRAAKSGIVEINTINIRDYSADKHGKCDDAPFGGGAGMVMMPQPIFDCINAVDPKHEALRIYMSPKGDTLSGMHATRLAGHDRLLLLCGHYEGVDQRVIDACIDEELSIGDYILTGGELAAMVTVDALLRFIPGVLGSGDSAVDESFSDNLLEYPQYTRPAEFNGKKVPDVLLSGHHENIEKWRREQSKLLTEKLRPDLLKNDN